MRIPMVFEPTFARDSIWCTEIKRGMTRVMHVQKYEALLIPGEHYRTYDYEALFAPGGARLLILCGTSPSWLRPALLFFRERGIGVLLVDGYPNAAPYVAGQVTFDYRAGMAQALACLRARGCRRIALFGAFPNSSADGIKHEAFLSDMRERGVAQPEELCFPNDAGLHTCCRRFLARRAAFDAVICVNEIATLSLLRQLGDTVPDLPAGLCVFSVGGARLRELSAYPFPFLLLDFARLGEQAVRLFRYLYTENDPAVHTFLRLDGRLIDPAGGAPVCHPAEGEGAPAAVPVPDGDFYHDEEVRLLSCLGRFLSGCDALDYRILGAVLGGSSYEQAAEDLHTARNTVVYRMRRLWTSLGFHSGRELIVYLRIHHFEEILTGNPQKTREDGKTEGNP